MSPAAGIVRRAPAELRTARLLLRPFCQDDIDAYAALCADDEVMRFLGGVISREDAWRQMAQFAGQWSLRGYGIWAAEELATGTLVGRIGLHQPEGWPGLEVAWTLARGAWGRGLATEGARASMRCAFETLGASRVVSVVHPDNARSARVAERIGERPDGSVTFRGMEVTLYALTRDAWAALPPD